MAYFNPTLNAIATPKSGVVKEVASPTIAQTTPVAPTTSKLDRVASKLGISPEAMSRAKTLVDGYKPPTISTNDIGVAGVTVPAMPKANIPSPTIPELPTKQTPTEMTPQDMLMQNYADIFKQQQEFDPTVVKNEFGYYDAQDELNNIIAERTAFAKETRDTIQEMRKNPEGKLRGALEADIQNYEYDRYDADADMAISQMVAQGRFDSASEKATDAINMQTQRFEQGMTFVQGMFNMLQNDLTESEKMQFQSQLTMKEYGFKALQESKSEAVRIAGINGAPADVIAGIKNATTPEEVWGTAGQYGIDPTLTLAQDRFAWEKSKYWNDLKLAEQIRTGEITAKKALEVSKRDEALSTAGNYLQSIQDLSGNTKGLLEATGTTFLGRTGLVSPFSAKRANFIAKAKYVLNNETFKKLADITQNTSLGAISEGELKLVESASTELGGYAVYNGDNELVGFDGSHEDVLEAIIKLEDAQKAYIGKIMSGAVTDEEKLEIEQMRNNM